MNNTQETAMLVPIKEFSNFTGVKESVLRYYDDIGLFSPITRGANNYRYYSLSQIQTIKLIETLRELEIPLKSIEGFMNQRSPESTVDLLTQREFALNAELRTLQESFSLLHYLRTLIQSGTPKDERAIEIIFEEEQQIALGPDNMYGSTESYHRAYSNYYREARAQRLNLGYHIGAYFDTMDEFMKDPTRPKRFYSNDPNGFDIKPAGRYLVGYNRGDYGVIGDLPERLYAYAAENNIKIRGPIYHVYPLNEVCYKDPKDYLSRVSALI